MSLIVLVTPWLTLDHGAGRVLIIAVEMFNFKRAVGIEFSPSIHETLVNNIRAYCRRMNKAENRFELVQGDVVDFVIPVDCRIFFFYSPFKWNIYEIVLDKIEDTLEC